MSSTPSQREAARLLVWEIKRAGFTQLRKTSDGFLYGSGTFRFTLPYNVAQGSASPSFINELRARFAEVAGRRDAEFGKPRMASVVNMEPVEDPEDLLRKEGGPPAVDTEVVNLAGAGSTPAPPANTNADARWGPGTATPALEGSTPSVGTTPMEVPLAPEEVKTMAKHFDCPKCGRRFAKAMWLGRHVKSCKGIEQVGEAVTKRGKRTKTASEVTVVTASVNGYKETVEAFTKASADMVQVLNALHVEVTTLKKERNELAKWKGDLQQMFSTKN